MDCQEISKIFNTEAEKLEYAISQGLTKSELSFPEIIEIYYQTMNVHSLATLLKQKLEGSSDYLLINKVEQTLIFISDKFDSNIHPSIMKQLANSIDDITKNLQSGNTLEKSQNQIESEARLYEKLRQTMSTKEFVEQYDKGLSYD